MKKQLHAKIGMIVGAVGLGLSIWVSSVFLKSIFMGLGGAFLTVSWVWLWAPGNVWIRIQGDVTTRLKSLLDDVIRFQDLAKKEGVLSLESVKGTTQHPVLLKLVQFLLEGVPSAQILHWLKLLGVRNHEIFIEEQTRLDRAFDGLLLMGVFQMMFSYAFGNPILVSLIPFLEVLLFNLFFRNALTERNQHHWEEDRLECAVLELFEHGVQNGMAAPVFQELLKTRIVGGRAP